MFDVDVSRPETEITLMRRVSMITGVSRGIGAATALVLAERGFRWSQSSRERPAGGNVTFPLGGGGHTGVGKGVVGCPHAVLLFGRNLR
jgi:NAD(P)-dependent dehydrogenase (short-subunit alcohol dehydrogenase family)